MKRVASKKLPKRFKTVMSKQLVGGISGYGSELVYHTVSDLRTLRTAVCNGLGRSRAGNNPYLSTHVTPGVEDVAISLLLRKLFFWRRFFRIFPGHKDKFLQMLVLRTHKIGATAFLRRTLQDHGWKCKPGGIIQHDRGWKICWTSCSRHVLRKLMAFSWSAVVCKHVQHRKGFDIEGIDVKAFHASISALEDGARSHALNLATGKHVTNEALVHYSKGATSDKCPLCGERDSRSHRVWDCAKTEEIRRKRPKLMAWLEQQDMAVSSWGLIPLDFSWIDWRFDCNPNIPQVICKDHDLGRREIAQVFADGSAVGQNLVGFTLASAAYVQCTHYTIIATCAEPMPGNDHTSYRGEIWALIIALRDFRMVHVYTDCAAVVSNLVAAISARQTGTQPKFSDHDDLWGIVWELISNRDPGSVCVTKVKAHQDITSIADPFERWLCFMNNQADSLARKCLHATWKGLVKQVQKRSDQRCQDIEMLREFHLMWNEMNEAAILASKTQVPSFGNVVPIFQVSFDETQAVRVPCCVSADAIGTCRYTAEFAKRVCRYFHDLEWDFSRPNVSRLEVYIDFTLWTGTIAPCLMDKQSHTYKLPDMCTLADLKNASLRDQSRVWTKTLAWLRNNCDTAPAAPTRGCVSLVKLGYSQQHYGLRGMPRFRCGKRVLQTLWEYFHPEQRSTNSRSGNLNRKYKVTTPSLGGA